MVRVSALAFTGLAGLALLVAAALADQAIGPPKPANDRATIIVRLPADATLEFEGAKTKQTGEVRKFISPPITPGKIYVYTIKATWTENGKPKTIERTFEVKAGEQSEVNLLADAGRPAESRTPDVVFVPTPMGAVEKMLEMAEVKKTDIVYDLGCGDGRIPVTAAKKYGCKAWGFDIDPQRIKESLANVKKNKVENLVTIEQKDIFTLDLSKATVITLYLLPSLNVKLIPQLEKCKPGTRIVSHDFDMRGVKPKKVETITAKRDDGTEKQCTIYLWVTPLERE
jgi:uncharacterized protein (TIGR03000 family)